MNLSFVECPVSASSVKLEYEMAQSASSNYITKILKWLNTENPKKTLADQSKKHP